MKDGTAMPVFLGFTRSTLSIWANNPTAPADVGTFVMQIVLRDVYGNAATLDVTLIIVTMLASPVGIGGCYYESVVPQGYAYDTNYVLGTYKQTKF